MKINLRGRRAYLYRRSWVPAGEGVSLGHPVDLYIGAMDAVAEEIPPKLRGQLTANERLQLEAKVCIPARATKAQLLNREVEPGWRIDDAARLLEAAAKHSEGRLVPRSRLAPVQAAVAKIRVFEGAVAKTQVPASTDRLNDALVAIRAAAQAVRDGAYGHAPADGARSTRTYRLWSDLLESVTGDHASLLRALQAKGFAKRKGGY